MILDTQNSYSIIFNKKNKDDNIKYESDEDLIMDYEKSLMTNTKIKIQPNIGYSSDYEDDEIINESNYISINNISQCYDEYLFIILLWCVIIFILIVTILVLSYIIV